ncbi:MAG: Smr/MutS family protein [Myxococcota bacterium]
MTAGRKKGRKSKGPDTRDDAVTKNTDSFADWADDGGEVKPLADDSRHGPYRSQEPTPPRPGDPPSRPTAEPIQFPDPGEPLLARRPHLSESRFRQLCSGKIRPGRRLDLHGLDRDSARRILITTLETAASLGIECVLVVHGKGHRSATGEAVLRQALPEWLSSPQLRHLVLAFSPASRRDGGAGAVYVLLG